MHFFPEWESVFTTVVLNNTHSYQPQHRQKIELIEQYLGSLKFVINANI
jgi:hypothetical protein